MVKYDGFEIQFNGDSYDVIGEKGFIDSFKRFYDAQQWIDDYNAYICIEKSQANGDCKTARGII